MPDPSSNLSEHEPQAYVRVRQRLAQMGFDDEDISALMGGLNRAGADMFDSGYAEAVRTCVEVLKAAPNRLHALHTIEELRRASQGKQETQGAT